MIDPNVEQAEISSEDLKRAAVSGVRWTTAALVAVEAVTLISAVVLARLIAPSGFGEAVVPLILVPLAVIFTFEGFGSALVQRKTIERGHIEAAMLASSLTGALLTATTLLLAQPLGKPLFGAASANLMMVISPVFLLAGIGAVSRGLLWRRLDFRRVSVIEAVSLVLGAVVAVTLAVTGLGAEAIVLGALCGSLVAALLLLLAAPPPLPRWHRAALGEVVRFGLPASGAGLTYVAITNSTLAVAAASLSPAQVGLFWRAFQLGVIYQDKVSGIMTKLAFPVYSRTPDLNELRRLHERATRIHAAVLVPLLSLLIVTAPDLVPWVFGERWASAVGPVQILCVAGMIAAILTGYPQIMLAAGRPRALLAFNLVLLSLYLVASWIAVPRGINALAIAVVCVHIVQLVAVYAVLFRRVLGLPVRRLVTDLLPAVLSSLVLLGTAVAVAALLHRAQVPVPVFVAGVGLCGAIAYLLALRALFPSVWGDLLQLTQRVLPSPNTTLAALRPSRTSQSTV